MNKSSLIVIIIIVMGGAFVSFSAPPVKSTSPTHSLGFWIDERDMWSGVGLAWTPQQFVTNYFESPPYPSAMLFATALSPSGPKSPGVLGEAQWLSQVASLSESSGLNVNIIILFFVNLSGQTVSGVPDQTSLLTQYMSTLGSHSNIYGAEYEVEYYGNTQAEEQSFYNIITGAGYVDVLNPGTNAAGVTGPVLDYSNYPYFGGSIPSSLSANSIGVGYGETGAPSGSTPNPAWTQSTVQAIVETSPGNPFVIIYSDDGGAGQPAYELWNWSTLRQWVWTDPSYQQDFVLSSDSIVTSSSTTSTVSSTSVTSVTPTSTTTSTSTTSVSSTTASTSSVTSTPTFSTTTTSTASSTSTTSTPPTSFTTSTSTTTSVSTTSAPTSSVATTTTSTSPVATTTTSTFPIDTTTTSTSSVATTSTSSTFSIPSTTTTSTSTTSGSGASTTTTVAATRTVTKATISTSTLSQGSTTETQSTTTATTQTERETQTTSTLTSSEPSGSATIAKPAVNGNASVSRAYAPPVIMGLAIVSAGAVALFSVLFLDRRGLFFSGGHRAIRHFRRKAESSLE